MVGRQDEERREPLTLGDQLGLGKHWTPTRFGWQWHTLAGGREGVTHVLVLTTQTGQVAVPLSPTDLERFIERARAQAGGVQVASEEELMQMTTRVGLGGIG